ncbi:3-deoxy-D-manno-octulosonic acid transferase [Pelagibacteraceae bacterium]|nr:3-deoxy-D-manno-octulosonic acid transferase [Pelagibacteraceae bacterium]
MFFFYRLLINLILIFSPIIILIRLFKKKEHPIRFKEKFGFYSKKKKYGKLIWIHGASIGEILSVVPLIERLEKNKNVKQILVTSNTLSSSKILLNLKLKKTIHQFFPIDTDYHTKKFLDYWKPSVSIFVDSEIWPNMIENIKKKKISLLLINARITQKSFKRWKMLSQDSKKIFQKFDMCLSSSKRSSQYLKILGAKKIKFIGNLKFTESESKKDNLDNRLKKFFLLKKIWCASSTHNEEEIICANVHKKLKNKHKKLLTIMIPRHVDRTIEIMNQIKKLNLKIHLHDSKNRINNDTDIYLVNSFGQTKSFFKICKTVFLGGSMIKHGGQNPIEAARLGCKILHGPHVSNFDEIYGLLKKSKVSNKVATLGQLTHEVNKTLNNKNRTRSIELKIKNLGNKILNSTLNEVNIYINK